MFFLIPFLVCRWKYSKQILATTATGVPLVYHYPMFIFGVILADLETQPEKPLDQFRNMSTAKTILWNSALIFIGLSFGSYTGDGCHSKDDDICLYWRIVTLGTFLAKWFCAYVGGLAIIVLALTSKVTQTVLGTDFFQFFGRISYTLYLVHELIIFWPENDFVREMSES